MRLEIAKRYYDNPIDTIDQIPQINYSDIKQLFKNNTNTSQGKVISVIPNIIKEIDEGKFELIFKYATN